MRADYPNLIKPLHWTDILAYYTCRMKAVTLKKDASKLALLLQHDFYACPDIASFVYACVCVFFFFLNYYLS